MRKITRASIMLIAIGVLLIPEAYMAHSGELSPSGVARGNSPVSSQTLFLWRGQILEGDIKANASVILYIMDEMNYMNFVDGNSWHPLVTLLDVSNASFDFEAPASGYYRITAVVNQNQEDVELTASVKYFGVDLDHYQSGLAFVATGTILIAVDTILRLESKARRNRSQMD